MLPEGAEPAEPGHEVVAERGEVVPAGGEPPRHEAPHAGRFRVALVGLAAVATAAITAAAVMLAGPGASPGAGWSAWAPSDTGIGGAQQIAAHVAPAYRLPGGDELAVVRGGPLEVAGLKTSIVLESQPGGGSISLLGGRAVLYTLCGLGPTCSLTGRPTVQRHLLLRREALELALYTFHYLRGIDQVVALLPPAPGAQPTQALLFRPDGLRTELDRPLSATLGARAPTVATIDRAPETPLVNRVTLSDLFQFSFQPAQDATAYLVLAPFPPGTGG
jgi:hypothetical protein